MSFMCTAGQADATIKSNTTVAQDNAAGATNTAAQYAAKANDPSALLPSTPSFTDALMQAAQARQAQQLLTNSRSQAFGNSAGAATGRISLLG